MIAGAEAKDENRTAVRWYVRKLYAYLNKDSSIIRNFWIVLLAKFVLLYEYCYRVF